MWPSDATRKATKGQLLLCRLRGSGSTQAARGSGGGKALRSLWEGLQARQTKPAVLLSSVFCGGNKAARGDTLCPMWHRIPPQDLYRAVLFSVVHRKGGPCLRQATPLPSQVDCQETGPAVQADASQAPLPDAPHAGPPRCHARPSSAGGVGCETDKPQEHS